MGIFVIENSLIQLREIAAAEDYIPSSLVLYTGNSQKIAIRGNYVVYRFFFISAEAHRLTGPCASKVYAHVGFNGAIAMECEVHVQPHFKQLFSVAKWRTFNEEIVRIAAFADSLVVHSFAFPF